MPISKQILQIIAEFSVVPEPQITYEDSLSSLGIDSLKMIELIITLEDTLNFQFNDSVLDINQMNTVEELITITKESIA